MSSFEHVGHPKNRFVGPLQLGWHKWRSEEGKWLGLIVVTSQGEALVAALQSEAESKAQFEEYCRIVEATAERKRKHAHETAKLLGEIWNQPMSY
ncbi:MAG: hypothetical protein ACAH17_01330 [Candidatus Paceibacterota bacterium]